jgi:hypothetical protein
MPSSFVIYRQVECVKVTVMNTKAGQKMDKLNLVDHTAIRFNQAMIISLSLVGFIFNVGWVVGLVGLVMLLGSLMGQPGFGFLYQGLFLKVGWLKPDLIPDHPEPHRFSQTLGGLILVGSGTAFLAGAHTLAWALCWTVIFLASLNLFAGFCAGCFTYYWLSRAGFSGFSKNPPPGTFPGMRPKVGGE